MRPRAAFVKVFKKKVDERIYKPPKFHNPHVKIYLRPNNWNMCKSCYFANGYEMDGWTHRILKRDAMSHLTRLNTRHQMRLQGGAHPKTDIFGHQ